MKRVYNIFRLSPNVKLIKEKTTVKDAEWDQINNDFEVPKDIYNPAGFEEIGEVDNSRRIKKII